MSGIEAKPSLKAFNDVSMMCFSVDFKPSKIPVKTSSWRWALKTNDFLSFNLSQMNPKVKILTYLINKSSLLMFELIFSTIPSHSFLGISMQQMAATMLAAALLMLRSASIMTLSTLSLTICLDGAWRLSHK